MPSPSSSSSTPEDLVAALPARRWSSDAAVSFEAAQEAVNEVLACNAALLDRERRKSTPDHDRIAVLRSRITDCAHQQRLLPTDRARLAEIRADYSRRVVELRDELA